MDLTIFLTQVVGIYLVLMGLIFSLRRRAMIPAMVDLIKNKAVIYVVAVIELIAGLSLVIAHNVWVWNYPVIITLVGWMMIIESLSYLVLPYSLLRRIFKSVNTNSWYIGGGVGSIILGLYMIVRGFGLM